MNTLCQHNPPNNYPLIFEIPLFSQWMSIAMAKREIESPPWPRANPTAFVHIADSVRHKRSSNCREENNTRGDLFLLHGQKSLPSNEIWHGFYSCCARAWAFAYNYFHIYHSGPAMAGAAAARRLKIGSLEKNETRNRGLFRAIALPVGKEEEEGTPRLYMPRRRLNASRFPLVRRRRRTKGFDDV